MKSPFPWIALLLLMAPVLFLKGQKNTGEIVKFTSSDKVFGKYNHQYLVYKPSDFKQGSPLIVYLHDNKGVGTNIDYVRASGLIKLIEEGKSVNALVIAPQLPDNMGMNWGPAFVDEFITHASEKYKVDKNRIYLTGYSMGAQGVWSYALEFPDKLACVVPVSGWGDQKKVCQMKKVPAWVFHGAADEIVTPQASRNMYSGLKNCGGDVRLTELPGVRHQSSMQAYTYEGLFEWILSHNKADTVKKKTAVQVDKFTMAYKLPKALSNVTGISYSPEYQWLGINEKDILPLIISFDTTGKVNKLIHVLNATNSSWQDMTRSEDGHLFIGDVGNKAFKRKSFQIYKINEHDLGGTSVKSTRIDFTVPGTIPLDFTSLFYAKGFLYTIGESAEHERYLLKISPEPTTTAEATIVGKFPKLDMPVIKSATFDSRQNKLYLLGDKSIGIITLPSEIDFAGGFSVAYRGLPYKSQKESIFILPSGKLAFADQNFLGTIDGNIYLMKVLE